MEDKEDEEARLAREKFYMQVTYMNTYMELIQFGCACPLIIT